MSDFILNERLANDTWPVSILGLCELRLLNDTRWPWFVLIPQRAKIEEIYQLTPLDQTLLTFEMGESARALKQLTGCAKINIGALGNMVRQLHIHVIARNEDDIAWPGPVWGVGKAEPYDTNSARALMSAMIQEI